MRSAASSIVGSLPSPPLVEAWLFEMPWVPASVLVVLALVMLVALNRRAQLRAGVIACSAMVGAAVVILAAGLLVETTREELKRLNIEFIGAFVAGDSQRVGELVSERMVFTVGGSAETGFGRTEAVRSAAEVERLQIRGYSIDWRGAAVEGARSARTRFLIRVESGLGGMTFLVWEFGWVKEEESWRITALRLQRVNGNAPPSGWGRVLR